MVVICLTGCRAIDTVQDNLVFSGYEVIEDEEQLIEAYTSFTIYDQQTVVGYMYEFPTFYKARHYYLDEDFESRDDGMIWIIHNQLIVGTQSQDIINTITK